MTNRYLILSALLVLTFTACKREKKDMLAREWQEIATENPQFEEVLKSQQDFIDTIGKSTTPEQNIAAYGVANIDSFRRVLQSNMDSFKKMQQRSIAATRFDFRKTGMVYIHTDLGVDSATWKLEEDGTTLVLDEGKSGGTQLQMEVTHLSDTSLKLRFSENNTYSAASFVPVKK